MKLYSVAAMVFRVADSTMILVPGWSIGHSKEQVLNMLTPLLLANYPANDAEGKEQYTHHHIDATEIDKMDIQKVALAQGTIKKRTTSKKAK